MSLATVYGGATRTRGPQNLGGPNGTQATTATTDPSGAAAGYSTKNQRYLWMHLDTSTSNENRTVTVYGFIHAFGVWFPLKTPAGTAVTTGAISDSVSTFVFEIAGVDRVYFKINGALHATDEFYAACNTIE